MVSLLAAVLLLPSHGALADKRVALVIGNGAYSNAPPLPGSQADASTMANALAGIGFDVTIGTDLTRDNMIRLLRGFGERAQDADVAVFFYAGYALSFSRTNYLMPADAEIKSAMDLERAAIGAGLAIDLALAGAKTGLIFLDASHANPFIENIRSSVVASSDLVQAGLAEMQPGSHTLISFANSPEQAAPNSPVDHSLFARALARNIIRPGMEIRKALEKAGQEVAEQSNHAQLPWTKSDDKFSATYLNRDPGSARATVPTIFTPQASAAADASPAASPPAPAPRIRPTAWAILDSLKPRSRAALEGGDNVYAGLPDFPWPPPIPSTHYVLPDAFLGDHPTLGSATLRIIGALEQTGYVEQTFFRTDQGGLALVTRLERIKADGTPARPDRWSVSVGDDDAVREFAKFLKGLFFVEKGHYRLLVFILQKDAFVPSTREMTGDEASDLLEHGANVLPPKAADLTFEGGHCTLLVYEFASSGNAVRLVKPSSLTGKDHLAKAGLLAAFGKQPQFFIPGH
jgi:uncharacterized caspase-like protein